MIPIAGLFIAAGCYVTAWFAVLNQDYTWALAYGILSFALWLVSLDLRQLLKGLMI